MLPAFYVLPESLGEELKPEGSIGIFTHCVCTRPFLPYAGQPKISIVSLLYQPPCTGGNFC